MKADLLQRASLKLLNWVLKDADKSAGHPLNTAIYRRGFSGRTFDRFTNSQVSIGEYSYGIRRECFFAYHPNDRLVIGKFCSVADGVRFVFGEHELNRVSTFPFQAVCFGGPPHADAISRGHITVGNDVWIGVDAIILSGVEIGHGAVIGAGALVNKNVPPYAVVGGIPARVIKYRLRADQMESLLRIQWWNWPLAKIRENLDLFYGDVDAFISRHGERKVPAEAGTQM